MELASRVSQCQSDRTDTRRPPVSKSEFLGSQCLAERLRVRVPRHAEPTSTLHPSMSAFAVAGGCLCKRSEGQLSAQGVDRCTVIEQRAPCPNKPANRALDLFVEQVTLSDRTSLVLQLIYAPSHLPYFHGILKLVQISSFSIHAPKLTVQLTQ